MTSETEKSNAAEESKKRSLESSVAITTEGEMPQKRFYRSRAHCNPLSHNDAFEYPLGDMDWSEHYPTGRTPTVLDIGCGFGGLTVALSQLLPNETVLGMEIRAKVTEYVRLRIVALRKEHPGKYDNTSVLRTNSMRYLPNYFPKASCNKLFFCFPDPHFKRKNHGRRIISERLLTEYAYILKPGGRLYCITDVHELHKWHVQKCDNHPMFKRLEDALQKEDPCVEAMNTTTEESQKVDRAGSSKYYAVYERIPDNQAELVTAENFFKQRPAEDKENKS